MENKQNTFTLVALRVNKGMNQDEASRALGISKKTLSSYEKGYTFPSVEIIKKIERLYGVRYSDINFLI